MGYGYGYGYGYGNRRARRGATAAAAALLLIFSEMSSNADLIAKGVTYSGTSLATMYDSTGKLTYKPNNLLTYSDDFSNGAWTRLNMTTAPLSLGPGSAPDGVGTAYTITFDAVSSQIRQTKPFQAGVRGVFVVWAKASASGGAANVRLTTNNGVGWVTGITQKHALTSEWQRISLVGTLQTGTSNVVVIIGTVDNGGVHDATCAGKVDIAFSRLSAVTYETSYRDADDVSTTSAAHYGPRFDYDPVTLAAKGLLVEEARTNLALNSQNIGGTGWTLLRTTQSADATTAPDGTTTADKIVEDTNTNTHGVAHLTAITVVAGSTNTYSFFIKPAGRTFANIQVSSGASVVSVGFDLTTGAVSTFYDAFSNWTSKSASVEALPDGWYRCILTAAHPSATSMSVNVFAEQSLAGQAASYLGDGASGLYVWGADFQAGSFITSHIPTASAAVSRVADSVSMTGTAFSDWYNQSEGTFVIDFSAYAPTAVASARIFGVSDGTTNERIISYFASRTATALVTDGGVGLASIAAGDLADGASMKLALAYAANDIAAVSDGGAVGTDTSATLPTPTRLQLFALETTGAGSQLSGHIKSLTYYNTRKANAELVTLTEAA